MSKMLSTPCGGMVDWDKVPDYNQELAMSGKFCPYDQEPLDDNALAHFVGTTQYDQYVLGVNHMKAQLEEKNPPSEPESKASKK